MKIFQEPPKKKKKKKRLFRGLYVGTAEKNKDVTSVIVALNICYS